MGVSRRRRDFPALWLSFPDCETPQVLAMAHIDIIAGSARAIISAALRIFHNRYHTTVLQHFAEQLRAHRAHNHLRYAFAAIVRRVCRRYTGGDSRDRRAKQFFATRYSYHIDDECARCVRTFFIGEDNKTGLRAISFIAHKRVAKRTQMQRPDFALLRIPQKPTSCRRIPQQRFKFFARAAQRQ